MIPQELVKKHLKKIEDILGRPLAKEQRIQIEDEVLVTLHQEGYDKGWKEGYREADKDLIPKMHKDLEEEYFRGFNKGWDEGYYVAELDMSEDMYDYW